jgi:hypothetical protein
LSSAKTKRSHRCQVAEILDRSESIVSRFLKRSQKTGNIENIHRSGRPKLITERGARKLSKIVNPDRRQSLRDITHEFNASNVKSCSTRTIQRNLPSLGYNRRFVCKTIVVRKATEKGQNDKQRSAKHSHKAKDGFTRTPPKTGDELMCSGRVSSSCSTNDIRHANLVTKSVISHE